MLHLNSEEITKFERIVTLLDECFYEGVKTNSLHEQTDGNVEIVISLGNTLERAKGTSKVETTIVVNFSMIEEGKTRHFFASFDEALETIQSWHNKFFEIDAGDVRVSQEVPRLRIVK